MGCNNLAEEFSEVVASPSDRHRLGEFGERVTAQLLSVLGATDLLVDHAHRDRPQGVDVLAVDNEQLVVAESKATAVNAGAPHLTKGQMTTEWVVDRLNTTGVLSGQVDAPVEAADVGRGVQAVVVKVDVAHSEVTTWSVDESGSIDRSAPDMTFDLADIIEFSQRR